MNPFAKCPVCGGELVEKAIEKLLRGGKNTAACEVIAEVCLRCDQRFFGLETVKHFEQIRGSLEREVTDGLRAVGIAYEVVDPPRR